MHGTIKNYRYVSHVQTPTAGGISPSSSVQEHQHKSQISSISHLPPWKPGGNRTSHHLSLFAEHSPDPSQIHAIRHGQPGRGRAGSPLAMLTVTRGQLKHIMTPKAARATQSLDLILILLYIQAGANHLLHLPTGWHRHRRERQKGTDRENRSRLSTQAGPPLLKSQSHLEATT